MTNYKKNKDDSFCRNIDPVQLAVLSAFVTLIEDFISFISVLIVAQKHCEEENATNNKKVQAQRRIHELEEEIEKIKKELDY